jgi:hypothetical protein
MSQNLTQNILGVLPAGASTGHNCSLCGPGTYQTGSGRVILIGTFDSFLGLPILATKSCYQTWN